MTSKNVPPTVVLCLLSICGIFDGVWSQKDVRYADKPFPSEMNLLGRNITCGVHKPGKFPSRTWSCPDMKVDGRRLIFTQPGLAATKINCGEDDGRNDVAELCRYLLKRQGVTRKLWSAFVSEASCKRSDDERMVFVKNATDVHEWDVEDRGKGFIISLQCMILDT